MEFAQRHEDETHIEQDQRDDRSKQARCRGLLRGATRFEGRNRRDAVVPRQVCGNATHQGLQHRARISQIKCALDRHCDLVTARERWQPMRPAGARHQKLKRWRCVLQKGKQLVQEVSEHVQSARDWRPRLNRDRDDTVLMNGHVCERKGSRPIVQLGHFEVAANRQCNGGTFGGRQLPSRSTECSKFESSQHYAVSFARTAPGTGVGSAT